MWHATRAQVAIRTAHVLAGRVRLAVGGLRGSSQRAAAVESVLGRLAPIRQVRASAVTGRVLVLFDPEQIDLDRIAGEVVRAFNAPAPARTLKGRDASLAGDVVRVVGAGLLVGGLAAVRALGGLAAVAALASPGVSLAVVLVSGYPVFRNALRAFAVDRTVEVDSLIGIATLAALALGETLTALVVVWLIDLGELFQALTLRRSHRAIRDLLSVGDEFAWVLVQGQEIRMPLDRVAPGDGVVAHTGDRIPVDGAVVEGQAAISQVHITGEPLPVVRSAGDRVYAGSLVQTGRVVVRAERIGDETAVGRLIQRVEEARESQAPIQRLADRLSRRFVPVSLALATLVYLLTRDVRRSVTMLVVACPCAAGLSTPTAVGAAIGAAAGRGVLVKGGRALEAAGRVDAIVFDKTGTLTVGRPTMCDVLPLDGWQPDALLAVVAAAEVHSNHPVAAAIVGAAEDRRLALPLRSEHELHVGQGVRAVVGGRVVLVGNRRLLDRYGVAIGDVALDRAQGLARPDRTILWASVDGRLAGLLGVHDPVRERAREAVRRLRSAGVRRLLMVTGDGSRAAAAVAHEVGLDEFRAGVLPEEKQDIVRALQREGRVVAMVGDGVNDAPALAVADVGVAMGAAGSDLAVEAADIALAADDINQVPDVVLLGRRTLRTIHQNFAFSVGVNGVGVLLGAFGLLSPLMAAVLHNLSTVVVVANSTRLLGPARPQSGSQQR
ncbi:MAG: cation-translocating P-type ATPase [Chloroflexi bacterium]|nr:cation-translocating P-type ATPase [Chloroflexota bacterium]